MSLKILISFLLFLNFSFASESNWKDLHLINGCTLYSTSGKQLRLFPGSYCIFFEDGKFLSATESALRLFNKKNEVVWEIPGHFHHQLNLSSDRKRILTLSSELVETPQGPVRTDVILVISLDGKVLHRQSGVEIMKQAKQESINFFMANQLAEIFKTKIENTHFNSVYEIPKITNKNVPSYIKEGNIIVNGLVLGIHILSPDLKTVLFQKKFDTSYNHWVHDVQVKSNGNVIYFNNIDAIPGKPLYPIILSGQNPENYSSSVQELDPLMKKIIFNFSASPKSLFFSWVCGSVQELSSDILLFTHYLNGAYIYSKSKKTTLATVPGTNADYHRIVPSQQVKAQDLTAFLSHWTLKTNQN